MKCPKCGYLGFEDVERCRNCGYDFSLVPVRNTPELSIRRNDSHDSGAFDDLEFINTAASAARPEVSSRPHESTVRPTVPPSSAELPLFGTDDIPEDDAPLITRASPPRPPLAVRRSTPEIPKPRAGRPSPLDPDESDHGTTLSSAERLKRAHRSDERPHRAESQPAGLGARGLAAAIDLAILALIDVVVVYFTMQICGLSMQDLAILPKTPLIAFLIVQNGGYLVTFTAGGQTLGKMAAGIRIVPARSDTTVDLARSMVRTIVWVALALPAGLGFLTALIGRERRGLHDRCAGTRVVRASA